MRVCHNPVDFLVVFKVADLPCGITANFLCSLGRPITQTPVPQFELVRGKKTATFSEVFKPRVFFLCTGLTNVPGVTRHNCTHIGATQERLRSWKELQAVRRAARDESIPADVRQAWTAHLAQMEVAERGVGQDQLLAMTLIDAQSSTLWVGPKLPRLTSSTLAVHVLSIRASDILTQKYIAD